MKIKKTTLSLYFLLILYNSFFSSSFADSNYQVSDKTASMFIGDKEATVLIIEYASFTCPHCATFHTEVLPKLKADYINSGKVLASGKSKDLVKNEIVKKVYLGESFKLWIN